MMKKKINIILIIVVLGVWGMAGYRYIKNYFYEPGIQAASFSKNVDLQKFRAVRDTFILQPLPHDPFLSSIAVTAVQPRQHAVNSAPRVSVKPKTAPAVKPWPDIQYHGYIKSDKKGEVALLYINGNLVKMHKGESNSAITVKNIYKDSVSVVFAKQQRFFRKL